MARRSGGAHGCAIHAYVLMTNHVHLLVTPRSAESLTGNGNDTVGGVGPAEIDLGNGNDFVLPGFGSIVNVGHGGRQFESGMPDNSC